LQFAVQVNKGMELVSALFTFINEDGQAKEPSFGAWLKGFTQSDG
jgi:hypothetical protein